VKYNWVGGVQRDAEGHPEPRVDRLQAIVASAAWRIRRAGREAQAARRVPAHHAATPVGQVQRARLVDRERIGIAQDVPVGPLAGIADEVLDLAAGDRTPERPYKPLK
jgi:hypothetical protein